MPVPVLPPGTRFAKFSPDGRWLAYGSEEPQRSEVYVSPFLRPGGKRQISTNGGIKPRWRQDGKEIFYLSPDGRLMATEVRISGESVEVGATHALFGGIPTGNGYGYDRYGYAYSDPSYVAPYVAVARLSRPSWLTGLSR